MDEKEDKTFSVSEVEKRYELDLSSIETSTNLNEKVNVLFKIFSSLKLSIDETLLTDENKDFFKEI